MARICRSCHRQLIAAALGERFCRRVGEAVRLPVLPIGCSPEHADFPGTLSLHSDTLRAMLCDVLASLARQGFETAVVFSAHGGNYATLAAAVPALRAAAHPMRVCVFTDLERIAAVWHAASAAAGVDAPAAGHHAGEFETSMLLALRPELVRRSALAAGLLDTGADAQAIFYPSLRAHSPSGVVGDPRRACAARGERYLAAWVDVSSIGTSARRTRRTPPAPRTRSRAGWAGCAAASRRRNRRSG